MSKHIYPEDGIRIVTTDEACTSSLVVSIKLDDQTSTSLKQLNELSLDILSLAYTNWKLEDVKEKY